MKQGQKRNNAIQNCMLFEGIEPEKSEQLLKEKAQCRTFQKGECIYTPEHFEKKSGYFDQRTCRGGKRRRCAAQ